MDELGGPLTYNHYPVGWAHAMDTPFQWTKQVACHFGGTRNGLVISWPKRIKRRRRSPLAVPATVIDIVPTILEAAGVEAPAMINGVKQTPIEGVSMVYTFDDAKAPTRHKTQYFELLGNRGIYHDGWMANTTPLRLPWAKPAPGDASPNPDDFKWELYHVAEDFSQANNLAAQNPAKLKELQAVFDARGEEVQRLSARCVIRRACRRAPSSEPHARTQHVHLLSRARSAFPKARRRTRRTRTSRSRLKSRSGAGGADGVIITQGGRFGGWGLLIRDGKPEFDYAFSNQKQDKYRVASNEKLAPGKHTLKFDLQVRRPRLRQERRRHALGGRQAGRAGQDRTHDPRPLLARRDAWTSGEDTGTPVVEDYLAKMPFKFTGDLKKVVIELGKSGLTASETHELEQANKRVAAVRD